MNLKETAFERKSPLPSFELITHFTHNGLLQNEKGLSAPTLIFTYKLVIN